LPELAGPEGHSILGQVLASSLVAGATAYVSLRFLTRYFETPAPSTHSRCTASPRVPSPCLDQPRRL